MKNLFYSLLACAFLAAATQANFAQVQIASSKAPVEVKKTDKKDTEESTEAKPAAPAQSSSECESCRWFEPTAISFSMRYRTTTDSGDVRNLNQGQQRIILAGKFKFDKEGKYTINAHASSGYYFNWAYADIGWGAGGNESLKRGAVNMAPYIVDVQLPGAVNQAVSGYIAQNFPNASAAQIAQLRPALTAQFTPVVRQATTSAVIQSLQSNNSNPEGWNIYLRQLYFQAKPVKGLELSYGSMPINRGVNSESTSYDNDGYVSGARISVKRPDKFWFDEMSVTNAWLGDVYVPNFFDRTKRFKKSNYNQFLLRKKFNNRVDTSVDYTFQDGTDTMREGVLVNTKGIKVLDSVRVEAYQRIGENYVNNKTFKGGNGFYVEGEKTLFKKLNLAGGIANIDRNYTVYSEYSYSGLDFYGFALNGDQTGVGKRFVTKANYKVSRDFGISMLYSQAFSNKPEDLRYIWNKTHFNVAVTYDILEGMKRMGWFK